MTPYGKCLDFFHLFAPFLPDFAYRQWSLTTQCTQRWYVILMIMIMILNIDDDNDMMMSICYIDDNNDDYDDDQDCLTCRLTWLAEG